MRVTSITPMKNEGPYILEWVAHNRMIGINDMLVFTNHCSDYTVEILERLDELGLVRHATNPSVRMNKPRHHIELIRYVNELARLRRSDWVTFLDADEFVRIKTGAGKMEDLVAALPDADAITLSLHTYGCSGIDEIGGGSGLVTETFHKRGASETRRNPVKYLAKGDFPWEMFANNAPQVAPEDVERVNWVNGDGTQLPKDVIKDRFKGLNAQMTGLGLVDVAHYTIRSFQGFLLQSDRGSANPVKGIPQVELDLEKQMQYWDRFNKNEVTDEFCEGGNPDLRAAVDDLLKDPELRILHDASLAWHRDRAQELLKLSSFSDLYDKIRTHYAESQQ